jgi:hypothetical protein
MEQRLDYHKDASDAVKAMYALGKYIAGCGLEAITSRAVPGSYTPSKKTH